MAKKGGSGKTYTSKGLYKNVSKRWKNQARKEYLASPMRIINQIKAYKQGKNAMITIANPNPNETNKRFIRVPAKQLFAKNEG